MDDKVDVIDYERDRKDDRIEPAGQKNVQNLPFRGARNRIVSAGVKWATFDEALCGQDTAAQEADRDPRLRRGKAQRQHGEADLMRSIAT